MLGAREDQERACLLLQHMLQQSELAILIHFVNMQVDVLGRFGGGADGHADGALHIFLDQVRHRSFDGGGKEKSLPFGGHGPDDPLDCR